MGWETLVFGINTAICTATQVSLYYAMFGKNPRLPLDEMFPLPHTNIRDSWTTHILGLHQKYQTISQDLTRLECSEIVFNHEIKSPRIPYNYNPEGKSRVKQETHLPLVRLLLYRLDDICITIDHLPNRLLDVKT